MIDLLDLAKKVKEAGKSLRFADRNSKNFILKNISAFLIERETEILEANKLDLESAEKNNLGTTAIDRLRLNRGRILSMARMVDQVRDLPDPVGMSNGGIKHSNGLLIIKMRVPLGVVGVICESSSNVTVNTAALCIKTGNALILYGGRDSLNTNKVLADIIQTALEAQALSPYGVQIVPDISDETAEKFIKLNGYIDALIPVGGSNFIKTVMQKAAVPVIGTCIGNCQAFIDKSADLETVKSIVMNTKVPERSVSSVVKKIIFHKEFPLTYIKEILDVLVDNGVEIRACPRIRDIYKNCTAASEDDWSAEYNDYIIAVRFADSIDDAISHISEYSTKHSEIIVTNDYENSLRFYREIDAAAVYVNASASFTWGSEFGLASEIGISAQNIHSRGPMGLLKLTSCKYVAFGAGKIPR